MSLVLIAAVIHGVSPNPQPSPSLSPSQFLPRANGAAALQPICDGHLDMDPSSYPPGTRPADYQGSLVRYCTSVPNGPNGQCVPPKAMISFLEPGNESDRAMVNRHWRSAAVVDCLNCTCAQVNTSTTDLDPEAEARQTWAGYAKLVLEAYAKEVKVNPILRAWTTSLLDQSPSTGAWHLNGSIDAAQMDDMHMKCPQSPWPSLADSPPGIDPATYGNNLTYYCTKPDGLGGRCYRGRPDFRALDPSLQWPSLLAANATRACSSCFCQVDVLDPSGIGREFTLLGPSLDLNPIVDAAQRLEGQTFGRTGGFAQMGNVPYGPSVAMVPPDTASSATPTMAMQGSCPVYGKVCHAQRQCLGSRRVRGCGCNYDEGKRDPVTGRRIGVCGLLHPVVGLGG